MQKVAGKIRAWLKDEIQKAGANGVVLGLSGGIDSAVVAALVKGIFKDNCLGLIMPCYSNPQDAEDARIVADFLEFPVKEVLLDDAYDLLVSACDSKKEEGMTSERRRLATVNIKPRLRMLTLYYHANLLNYLVVGTGNRSELAVGYFTKYGDGGVDLIPLGGLVKKDVYALARYLGIPDKIIDKQPSAGLWEGQTDEQELGITYANLDHYLLTGEGTPSLKKMIEKQKNISKHKLTTPPIPPV